MTAVTQESVVEDITSLLSASDADERIRYGRTGVGTPRGKCKGCGLVRCHIDTGSILANTKLDEGRWMDYAMCFVDGLTCDEVAGRIGVCHKTAWFMRLRTMQAVFPNLPSFQVEAGNGVEIDEIYFRESFKGTRFDGMENVPRGAVFYHTGAVRQANTSRYITIPGVWGIERGEDIVALVCNLVMKEAVVVEARISALRTSKRFFIPCTHRWIAEPGAAVTIVLMRRGEFEARIAKEGADWVEGLVPGAVLRGMTMTRVTGRGEQIGLRFTNRVGEFIVDEIEKVKVETVVEDDRVDAVIDSIREVAGTGHPGDGRIFVIPVEMSVRIRADDRIPCQSRNDLDEGTVI